MKSNKQRRTELTAKRQARRKKEAAAQKAIETGRRNAREQRLIEQGIAVNVEALAPDNSYSSPAYVARGYYIDIPFQCRDCGKQETWTATQQKWWHEVAKGSRWTTAIRCRNCRRRERLRVAEARRIHLGGISRKARKQFSATRCVAMASMSEQSVSKYLRAALAPLAVGEAIADDIGGYRLSCFEAFLPQVLREIHPEWAEESLDGIYPIISRKTGSREAETIGHCILITDQTIVPFHLRVQFAADCDEICWLELRFGERANGNMVRTPYGDNWPSKHFLKSLPDIVHSIDWFYAVTFGEKQVDSAAL
jgi:hypothetical protein